MVASEDIVSQSKQSKSFDLGWREPEQPDSKARYSYPSQSCPSDDAEQGMEACAIDHIC